MIHFRVKDAQLFMDFPSVEAARRDEGGKFPHRLKVMLIREQHPALGLPRSVRYRVIDDFHIGIYEVEAGNLLQHPVHMPRQKQIVIVT